MQVAEWVPSGKRREPQVASGRGFCDFTGGDSTVTPDTIWYIGWFTGVFSWPMYQMYQEFQGPIHDIQGPMANTRPVTQRKEVDGRPSASEALKHPQVPWGPKFFKTFQNQCWLNNYSI